MPRIYGLSSFEFDSIKFAKKFPDAKMPDRQSSGSVGYDLYTPMDIFINPGQQLCIDTGIILEMPTSCYAEIVSKSRLAKEYKIVIDTGLIDSDYRGSLKVLLRNVGTDIMFFSKHDPIAQFVFRAAIVPNLKEIDKIDSNTDRGQRSFGQLLV